MKVWHGLSLHSPGCLVGDGGITRPHPTGCWVVRCWVAGLGLDWLKSMGSLSFPLLESDKFYLWVGINDGYKFAEVFESLRVWLGLP